MVIVSPYNKCTRLTCDKANLFYWTVFPTYIIKDTELFESRILSVLIFVLMVKRDICHTCICPIIKKQQSRTFSCNIRCSPPPQNSFSCNISCSPPPQNSFINHVQLARSRFSDILRFPIFMYVAAYFLFFSILSGETFISSVNRSELYSFALNIYICFS